ncbi:MAG TPA: hypothetical protein VE172_14495 [Stackebrandtia sp.]|jgi:hypothetical protein|uniref:hypothetical protein n=1 Tax=Stackebrandtia sp. TaxID=2023065 RepID=UPI002D70606F|nr:hypothetical protein [Stackebrandtia sp.]HZE40012.1 hypothetical protein [Stackebrandtia sp.]
MRHIASLLAGIIIAPIAWLLIGAGTIGLDPDGLYKHAAGKPSTVIAIAMFAVAGILLGFLATTRLSPTGPVVAALILGGLFALFRFSMTGFILPSAFTAVKVPVQSAVAAGRSGTVLAIAAVLVVALVVPHRWRGKDDDDRVVDTASLASPRSDTTSSPRSDAIDPFSPSTSFANTATPPTTTSDNFPSAGTGFDERPTDPFGGGQGSSSGYEAAPPTPEQRSPYADDGYGYAQPQSDGYSDQQYGQNRQFR